MTPLSEDRRERAFCGVGVRNNGTGWLFSLSPLLALSMSCALCPTPFAQQHLKLLGPPNSGRSVAEWAPSLKRATDACVLASNNASPAQRGPRRDAQPTHATPLAAVLFPAPLRARALYFFADCKFQPRILFSKEAFGAHDRDALRAGCEVWHARPAVQKFRPHPGRALPQAGHIGFACRLCGTAGRATSFRETARPHFLRHLHRRVAPEAPAPPSPPPPRPLPRRARLSLHSRTEHHERAGAFGRLCG